jgi:hypothetical protein
MAISFVGSGTVQTGSNPTLDVPAGVVAGDFLILITTGTTTPTTPTNWAFIANTSGSRFLTFYAKVASASESSLALTLTGTTSKAVMVAYRGVGWVDAANANGGLTGTSAVTTSITTRFANDYVLSIYANNISTATFTAPASTTTRINSSSTASVNGLLLVDELQAAAGATTVRTATLSSSVGWASIAIALKEPQAFYVDPENGNDANNGQTFATALKNISGATSAKAITAGDTVRIKEAPLYNTGVNATWTSVQQRGISPFSSHTITGATNAIPIVISTFSGHGYSTGDVVYINGVAGNTAANGFFKCTVIDSTSFSLDDSSGNGNRTSGGVIAPVFCRTIKTASALVQPIASFAPLRTVSLGTRVAWVGSTNVGTVVDVNFGKGALIDRIDINASFTTGKIAYYTLPATLNLSAYEQLSLYIGQVSGSTLGGLTMSLCSDTTGDTAVDTFTIPSTGQGFSVWCPFTINKGSALGSSIQSISISRAVNNGAQSFNFNSIVAVKSPTSVDALSNTSLVTKNNGTEGSYAVGGFCGSDGTIVYLESRPRGNNIVNNTQVGDGAYYGTTETASLWRYEPFNPYTLNGVGLQNISNGSTTYMVFASGLNGAINAPVTFSGGWDSTNMSTRTAQTWFSNQNGNGLGLSGNQAYITTDRVNYTKCNTQGLFYGSGSTGSVAQNCDYTSIDGSGINLTGTIPIQLQSCIVTNTTSNGVNTSGGSGDINTPMVINNCTFSGNASNNLTISANFSGVPYYTITNNSFNTSADRGIFGSQGTYVTMTSNSINYFNSTGIQTTSNILGTINNLTFVPEPSGASGIISVDLSSSYTVLPQNIYSIFNNLTVNAPTTAYSQGGVTTITSPILGGANCKFINGSFAATNVSYTRNEFYDQGGPYLYNCTGIPATVITGTRIVAPYIVNAAMYSQDEGNTVGNNKIYFSGGLGTSQTAVRNTASGYAWSLAPTSTSTVTSVYPLKLKIASVAANGGSAVTISAYMRRTNTGLTMQLVCPGGQPYGPSTDTVASMTAAADTWEQISISFTPTQNAVYDIYAYAFGGTTFTGYVDDVGVTQ